ncbi:MAG TPA: hypothetical protein VHJ17_07460, partial [Thermomonospora sp.]|nr:hypothetical protein [Thermomonospora sp.]
MPHEETDVRLKAMLTSAGVMAALFTGVSAANADEAFYTPPSPLPAKADGDVIKSQPSTYSGAKATRIMYLSRNAKNQAIPVTGTVIVPEKAWTGPGERPIVAYAPFTAGMGDQCAPSKTLAGEGSADLTAGFQKQFVDGL